MKFWRSRKLCVDFQLWRGWWQPQPSRCWGQPSSFFFSRLPLGLVTSCPVRLTHWAATTLQRGRCERDIAKCWAEWWQFPTCSPCVLQPLRPGIAALRRDCWMSTCYCVLLFGTGAAQEQAFSQYELAEHLVCSGYLPGGSRT